MASSSSSSTNQDSESISNNDRNPSWIYDVFLSFCDKDTSEPFASNLYTALIVSVMKTPVKIGRTGSQEPTIWPV